VGDLIRAIEYVDAALPLFQLMDEDYFVQIVNRDLERARDELRSQGGPQDQEEDELSNPTAVCQKIELSITACFLQLERSHTG